MKIANQLLLSSLALSASMIGCNKKSNESPGEAVKAAEQYWQSEMKSEGEKP